MALFDEFEFFSPALWLAGGVCLLIPRSRGGRLRRRLLQCVGISVGGGTTISGPLRIEGCRRPGSLLTIGEGCTIGSGVLFDLGDRIDVGRNSVIENEVALITTSHEIGTSSQRAGAMKNRPIVVGHDCRVGARATILQGVTLGAGSVVYPGSVVVANVEANTRVSGIPAKALNVPSPD